MRLSERVYHFYDSNGIIVDINAEKINLIINDIETDTTFNDILLKPIINGKGIIGYSLIEYFKISAGKLIFDNTIIGFIDIQSKNKLYIKNAKKFIYMDNIDIDIKYIDNFCRNIIPINDPTNIFPLNNSEIIELNKIKISINDNILKGSINQKYIYSNLEYEKVKKLFHKNGKGNEYIFNQYHIFYSNEDEETALFINHGSWFHEITCANYQVLYDKVKNIYTYIFQDDSTEKKLILNINNGELTDNPLTGTTD